MCVCVYAYMRVCVCVLCVLVCANTAVAQRLTTIFPVRLGVAPSCMRLYVVWQSLEQAQETSPRVVIPLASSWWMRGRGRKSERVIVVMIVMIVVLVVVISDRSVADGG